MSYAYNNIITLLGRHKKMTKAACTQSIIYFGKSFWRNNTGAVKIFHLQKRTIRCVCDLLAKMTQKQLGLSKNKDTTSSLFIHV